MPLDTDAEGDDSENRSTATDEDAHQWCGSRQCRASGDSVGSDAESRRWRLVSRRSYATHLLNVVVLLGVVLLGIPTTVGAGVGTDIGAEVDQSVDGKRDTALTDRRMTAGDEPTVEFLNCTAVRVEGTATIRMRWVGFFQYGHNYGIVERSVNESTILRPPTEAEDAEHSDELVGTERGYVTLLKVIDEDGGKKVYVNPFKERCHQAFLPEKINVTLVDVRAVSKDTYHVTFGYENPNDFTLTAAPPFQVKALSFFESRYDDNCSTTRTSIADRTNRSPPREFYPGTHTFTVEWQPEDDDERLVWVLDLRNFADPEWANLTATTPRAGHVAAETNDTSVDSGTEGSHLDTAIDWIELLLKSYLR
ncbi:hypothetical protein [Haladaptatus sp. NG-SE-30]